MGIKLAMVVAMVPYSIQAIQIRITITNENLFQIRSRMPTMPKLPCFLSFVGLSFVITLRWTETMQTEINQHITTSRILIG